MVSHSYFKATVGRKVILSAVHSGERIDINVRTQHTRCAAENPYAHQNLWKVMMELVRELERLLREWKGKEVGRYVLCPRCVEAQEAKPELIPLEYIQPGPNLLTLSSRRCLYSTTLSSAKLTEIIPPRGEW